MAANAMMAFSSKGFMVLFHQRLTNHCIYRMNMVLKSLLKRFDKLIISESGYIIKRLLSSSESKDR